MVDDAHTMLSFASSFAVPLDGPLQLDTLDGATAGLPEGSCGNMTQGQMVKNLNSFPDPYQSAHIQQKMLSA